MRALLVGLVAILCIGCVTSAEAEQRMFIVANDGDGYGIDRCLAGGEKCGAAAANAYCRTHSFVQATAYRRVERADITGAIPRTVSSRCHGIHCDDFVAITCMR